MLSNTYCVSKIVYTCCFCIIAKIISLVFLDISIVNQLVEIELNFEQRQLVINEKYAIIQSHGMKHYFYDNETDMMIIYRFLGTCTKFKYQLIMIPVASNLMQ